MKMLIAGEWIDKEEKIEVRFTDWRADRFTLRLCDSASLR